MGVVEEEQSQSMLNCMRVEVGPSDLLRSGGLIREEEDNSVNRRRMRNNKL
jgi:hypothetical protein